MFALPGRTATSTTLFLSDNLRSSTVGAKVINIEAVYVTRMVEQVFALIKLLFQADEQF